MIEKMMINILQNNIKSTEDFTSYLGRNDKKSFKDIYNTEFERKAKINTKDNYNDDFADDKAENTKVNSSEAELKNNTYAKDKNEEKITKHNKTNDENNVSRFKKNNYKKDNLSNKPKLVDDESDSTKVNKNTENNLIKTDELAEDTNGKIENDLQDDKKTIENPDENSQVNEIVKDLETILGLTKGTLDELIGKIENIETKDENSVNEIVAALSNKIGLSNEEKNLINDLLQKMNLETKKTDGLNGEI